MTNFSREIVARLGRFGLVMLCAAITFAPLAVLAQEAPVGQPVGSPVVTETRYYLDGLIVAALCVLALFTICRSSRRS